MARVVILLNRLIIGGAALDTVQLAAHLSKSHAVYLVVGEKMGDEYDAFFLAGNLQQVEVIPLHAMKRSINFFKDISAFWKIYRLLKKIRPDIVHTHGAKPGFLGRLAAKLAGVKVVIHTYHGHVFHSYFSKSVTYLLIWVERFLAGITTKLIALSESQKKELSEIYHIAPPSKFEVIKLGIDCQKFETEVERKRAKFRNEYHLLEHETAVGIVGRIVPIKNHFLFLDAARAILQQHPQGVRFFIIGDGVLRQDLEEKLLQEGLAFTHFPANPVNAPITFTSWMLNIDEVMAGLDVVVLSSLNEGTPISLMEAQATGRAVLSTWVGGVNEVVQHGETGIVVPPADLQRFTEALIYLIDHPAIREAMGERGKRYMHENYSRNRQWEAVDALYDQYSSRKNA